VRLGFRGAGRIAALASLLLYRLRLPERPALPADTPILIAVNHRSLIDSVIGFHSFNRWGMQPRFLVHQRYFAHPLLGPLLTSSGCVPAAGEASTLDLMRTIRTLFAERHPVLIMPEGRVVHPAERVDGLGPTMGGIAAIVRMTNPAVLAVGMTGTDEVWPSGARGPLIRLGRRRPLVMISAQLIEFPAGANPATIMHTIEETMRRLILESSSS
jgi:1-acyl-sn-glycerol-3-phosphate acyltransferase